MGKRYDLQTRYEAIYWLRELRNYRSAYPNGERVETIRDLAHKMNVSFKQMYNWDKMYQEIEAIKDKKTKKIIRFEEKEQNPEDIEPTEKVEININIPENFQEPEFEDQALEIRGQINEFINEQVQEKMLLKAISISNLQSFAAQLGMKNYRVKQKILLKRIGERLIELSGGIIK